MLYEVAATRDLSKLRRVETRFPRQFRYYRYFLSAHHTLCLTLLSLSMPLPASPSGSSRPNVFQLMVRKRSGPPIKHIEVRSVAGARVAKSTAPSQAKPLAQIATGVDEIDEEALIKQFEYQCAVYAATLSSAEQAIFVADLNDPDHSTTVKRRISYPREYKLSAITYALTGKILNKKTGEMKPITKWKAAQKLGITYLMMKDWIATRVEIETMKKGCRKNCTHAARFPALEQRFFEHFNDVRKEGVRITKQ